VSPFGRILVIRSGAIGDFIVTLPVIQLLRRAYPAAWLGLVAKNRVRPLVKNVVDEFVDIDGPLLVPFFQEEVPCPYLRKGAMHSVEAPCESRLPPTSADSDKNYEEHGYLAGFDLVISYLGKRGKLSENLLALRGPRVINANALPPESYDRHITEFLLEPLTEVLNVSSPPLPTVIIREKEACRAEKFLSECGVTTSAPLVAVHPGSGSPRKVSPPRNFCRAVNWIHDKFPHVKTMVIEGEADEHHVLAFERCLKTPCVKVKRNDLLEVAAILSRTSLFIGNDSGISHLAAAVGAPAIVIYRAQANLDRRHPSRTGSNPKVWAPKGENVWVATEDSLQGILEDVAKKIIRPAKQHPPCLSWFPPAILH